MLHKQNQNMSKKLAKSVFIPHKGNGYHPHLTRHYGVVIVMVLFLTTQMISNLASTGQLNVLAYATNVSIGGLLSSTNSHRQASGLSALNLNNQLIGAAQSKAAHMIANDYWSHVAPDGSTPWTFINASGYSYLKAGENLAFGFADSAGVVNGWMNSPSHRANMMDPKYVDVGFGFQNGEDYQGGKNTVVVAMYGQPVKSTSTSNSGGGNGNGGGGGSSTPSSPTAPSGGGTAPTNTEEVKKKKEKKKKQEKKEDKEDKDEDEVVATVDQRFLGGVNSDIDLPPNGTYAGETTISNFQAFLTGQANLWQYLGFSLIILLGAVYMYRHGMMLTQLAIRGEHFVVGHPMLEASFVYLLIWLMLVSTYGTVL